MRAGVYVFNDLMQLGYGSAAEEDLALSVLTTVVSHQARDRATIDGGSKTFSGDSRQPELARAVDRDVTLERISEEHGMVRIGEGASLEVGEKVAFHPSHVCTCVNLSDELVGGRVAGVWERRPKGKRLSVRIDAHQPLTSRQRRSLSEQAERVAQVLELQCELEFGPVSLRFHL